MGSIPITRSSFPTSMRLLTLESANGDALAARGGEIVLLSGGIGHGKSRWLRMLAGLELPPPQTRLRLNGNTPPFSAGEVFLRADRMPPLWLAPTIGEELLFGPRAPSQDELTQCLRRWRLDDIDPATPIEKLNRLQALQLSLACADLSGASLILLDEPLASLPDDTSHAMIKHIATSFAGRIVVVASNRWQDWRNCAARRWHLRAPGATPTPEELI